MVVRAGLSRAILASSWHAICAHNQNASASERPNPQDMISGKWEADISSLDRLLRPRRLRRRRRI